MNNKKTYILLLPIILIYTVFIVGGLISVTVESFGVIPVLGLDQPTISYYRDIIGQKGFLRSLAYSLYIAVISTSISTIIGVLLAYRMVISEDPFIRKVTKKILQVGLILPYLYVVFLVTIMLGKTGFISRVLLHIGLIHSFEEFPWIIFGPYGLGIIIVYILKGTPFIALFVMNVISNVSKRYHEVSKTLGADDFKILKEIYLPLASNAIVWASSIILVYNLGAFEVPYLLATNEFESLSSKLYTLYINPDIYVMPSAMAMNIILFFIGIIVVTAYSMILKKILKGRN